MERTIEGRDGVVLSQQKSAFWKFLICSIVGVLCFLVPVYWNGQWTIVIGIFAETLKKALQGDILRTIALTIVVSSAVLSIAVAIIRPKFLHKYPFLHALLMPSKFWLLLRVIGSIFIVMIYFQIGPEWVISKNTGGTILNDLNPVLIPFFFFAVLLLPFLVDYGLMEFIGVVLAKPFQKIFRLPGRSSIDAAASWLGSGAVGVLITTRQYETSYYTQREAAVIATNFSIASIAFSLLVVNFMGIAHLFVPFYATVVVTGIILAIIIPRIPPLSLKKDVYYAGKGNNYEIIPNNKKTLEWATEQAVNKAAAAPNIMMVFGTNLKVLLDVYLGLMPVVYAIGTVALALSEFTPIFTFLSYPFIYYLDWLGVPEATKAAPAMLVGFADMFLPAVLGYSIENDMTKFVIACTSLIQVIYLTEVGALILRSKIPLNLLELFLIFLLRTLIGLPIIVLSAKVLLS